MKHAFLIMAHTNYPLVARLLKKLDHSDHTIYLHIDAKSPFSQEDEARLKKSCTSSEVVLIDRCQVRWGGYSQIHVQLRLLERARQDLNDYYHFLSGVDFPIKPIQEIHDFFETHAGFEFLHFASEDFTNSQASRHSYYHFWQEKRGRSENLYSFLERGSLFLQRLLNVNRAKRYSHITFQCGSNWASITHDFSSFLLSQEKEIRKMFANSVCCDEFFMQTIAYNSPFRSRVFQFQNKESKMPPHLRTLDWERGDHKAGSPYTFVIRDYPSLITSPGLFCRKVSDATPEGAALIEQLEQL